MKSPTSPSQCLVVAGMHRSGTSMLAGFLKNSGLFIGESLLGANDSNQKGHFENVQFKDLHMNVLSALGQNPDGWTLSSFDRMPDTVEPEADALIAQNRNSGAALWGWKDPRTSLFLKYWVKKLPNSNYIFIFRPPWEVADSLYRRGDAAFANYPEFAFQVWQKYNEEVLDFCKKYPDRSVLVSIDELVTSPTALIEHLNNKFGYSLIAADPDFESSLLVKGSKHYQRFVHDKFPSAYRLWQQLENMSWRGGKVDSARTQMIEEPTVESHCRDWSTSRRLVRECKNLHAENKELKLQLESAQSKLASAEAKLQLINNSRLWKWRNGAASLMGKQPV